MAHSDSIPEERTTPLERAQILYEKALQARVEAERVLLGHDDAVSAARERLEQEKRKAAEAIPVDRSARVLVGGGAVTADHRDLKENGQQKGYVVLAAHERAKGFVRPYRDAYRHQTCGKITTMSREIAETYARDPGFYNGTFCLHCRGHFPIGESGEFTWYEMDGREGPKVGT